MNRIKKIMLLVSVAATAMLCACAGAKPETKVKYYVDGVEQETAPDKNFYEPVDIKSNSQNASVIWDCATWSLQTANIEGKVNIEIYFEYQKNPVTVDGIGFATLQEAFNYAGTDQKKVYLTRDLQDSGSTAVGSNIDLELGGFSIDGQGKDTIINNGKMMILGQGTITNTVDGEYSKSVVNYGELLIQGAVVSNSTNSVTIWNSENGQSVLTIIDSEISHSVPTVMTVVNSGTMELVSGTITGCGDSFHPTLYNNRAESMLTLSGGSVNNTADGYSIYNENGIVNVGGTAYGESYNVPEAYNLEK